MMLRDGGVDALQGTLIIRLCDIYITNIKKLSLIVLKKTLKRCIIFDQID